MDRFLIRGVRPNFSRASPAGSASASASQAVAAARPSGAAPGVQLVSTLSARPSPTQSIEANVGSELPAAACLPPAATDAGQKRRRGDKSAAQNSNARGADANRRAAPARTKLVVSTAADADAGPEPTVDGEPEQPAPKRQKPPSKPKYRLSLQACHAAVTGWYGQGSSKQCSLHIARRSARPSARLETRRELGELVLIRFLSSTEKDTFRLERNIDRVYAKARGEGKSTIRLKDPEIDLVVSRADPTALTEFLDALYVVHTDPGAIRGVPSTSAIHLSRSSNAEIARTLQRKLAVDKLRALPDAPGEYPPGLEWLVINGHPELTAVPLPVLGLVKLTILDLSGNGLKTAELGALKLLVNVNLSHNALSTWPSGVCTGTVRHLNLSHNAITKIPKRIRWMTNLETLNVSHNEISELPTFVGKLRSLQVLKIAANQLTAVPVELRALGHQRLRAIDLSANSFPAVPSIGRPAAAGMFDLPLGLAELAARAALKSKQYRAGRAVLPVGLVQLLERAGRCSQCRGPYLRVSAKCTTVFDLAVLADSCTLGQQEHGTSVPMVHRLCSRRCLESALKS